MPISASVSDDKRHVNISISDRFDYSLHQPFRDSYKDVKQSGVTYKLDLSQASYMDSSALGMVLLLKEHADGQGSKVVIAKPHPSVAKILKIANFDRFVTIEA
ncbi:STAS domain-containing protein [Neptunomonas marina]|uniref:Anti-sigma factor antagonist n=1 Tax=Neptunomonas marina TaxID=1815562 RepID=A0A437Q6E5_9GAMM|nr:STAS domain-containing protein [Neptunomonas marina]RVU30075.1 anti-sigma factor antagonist [Neptunomonas marina]